MTSEASTNAAAGGRPKLARKQKITNVVGLTVIALILGTVFYFARNNAANADVGDCVKDSGNSLHQVDCGSPDAKYAVVGKVERKSQAEATFTTCKGFKDTSDIYWEKSGGQSFVLCLADVSK